MTDNRRRAVVRPVPGMQSSDGINKMIRRGDRTAECFAELQARNNRVRRAREIIAELHNTEA